MSTNLHRFFAASGWHIYMCTLSLTGSASCTDLSQLANGIWEIHAGCSSFLHVSFVAKIGYIPQFKALNARDQAEVSSDLARMTCVNSSTNPESIAKSLFD